MSKIMLSTLLCLLLSPLTMAQSGTETRAEILESAFQDPYNPQGWWGFIGLNLGVVDSETKLKHEKDAGGSQFNLRALGSYYFQDSNWLGDVGLGLQNSHIGKGQMDNNVS
ncbi:MAG: hypothetical protein KDD40_10490, partial [Bdellovibrionales bacterium]|nr:hypothetical protein [Bdellovibrionales bacterium]